MSPSHLQVHCITVLCLDNMCEGHGKRDYCRAFSGAFDIVQRTRRFVNKDSGMVEMTGQTSSRVRRKV